jgi:DinB superfamily
MPGCVYRRLAVDTSEREFVETSLSANRERLRSAVDGLTPSQAEFCPGDDVWSILDCVEHVTVVENRIMKSIERVLQTPPEPEKAGTVIGKEKLILTRAPDRSTKVQAPEPVRPTRKCTDLRQLVAEFEAARDRSMQFAAHCDTDLRGHFFPHIRFGDLDCYQWLVFLSAHCDRHLLQIEEIKADTRYPQAGA